MPVPSLSELATNTCIAHIKRIDDVGDVPYPLVKPILFRIANPEQLRTIEKNSSQICGADAEVWRLLCKRYVPRYTEDPVEPKNPQNWYKVYRKLIREADEKAQAADAALKAALKSKEAEKQEHKMTFVQKVLNPSPRKTQQPRQSASTSLAMAKAKSGRDVLDRAKRQAQESSVFRAGKVIGPRNLPPQAASEASPAQTLGSNSSPAAGRTLQLRGTVAQPQVQSTVLGTKRREAPNIFMPQRKRRH